ncbi:hypothetical protein CSUI_009479, partial [Cystoisospora suis]
NNLPLTVVPACVLCLFGRTTSLIGDSSTAGPVSSCVLFV